MERRETFDDMLRVRLPAGLQDALQQLATRECQTLSSVIRTAVVQHLRDAGVDVNGARRRAGEGRGQ